MKGIFSVSHWQGRTLALGCVVVLPFAGFLISSRYPVARPEVAATVTLFAVWTLLAGVVLRQRLLFLLAYALAGAAVAAGPLNRLLDLPGGAWAVFGGVFGVIAGLGLLLRERLYGLVAVGALAMLFAHLTMQLAGKPVPQLSRAPSKTVPAGHFLYLILDEHNGIAGFPEEIAECRAARQEVLTTYLRHGFRLYSQAYSNYPATLDSIPSFLNRRLANRRYEFIQGGKADAYGIYHVDAAAFFDRFRRQGYAIDVTYFRGICFEGAGKAEMREYSDSLAPLAPLNFPWRDKAQLLIGRYQASDVVLQRWNALLPFRIRNQLILPIAVADWWPAHLLAEMTSARRPTLFFAHIPLPHSPYLYREDGSQRPLQEWSRDQAYDRVPEADYRARYIRYAAQVRFTARQVNLLLDQLAEAGLLDPLTIVVHSDHASRNRCLRPEAPVNKPSDRFDYGGAPGDRDLLDRFSILFAVKPPAAGNGAVDERRRSVLQLLAEEVYGEQAAADRDAMILFNEDQSQREVYFQ